MKFLRNLLASILGSIIGFILLFFIGILIIVSIAVSSSSSDKPKEIKENTVLVFKFDKPMVDRSTDNPFSSFDLPMFNEYSSYGLYNIVETLDAASQDPKVDGLYIDSKMEFMAPYATATELRDALLKFKESGKFIYTYIENSTQKAYYVASIADSIIINPEGSIFLSGLTSEKVYYKNVLDKAGVKIQVLKGEGNIYKSAVERYYRSEISKEDRRQTQKYLNDIWSKITQDVTTSRNISTEKFNLCADSMATFSNAKNALKYKLVDNLKYKDQVINDLKKLTNRDKDQELRTVDISKYDNSDKKLKKYHKNKIAVIFAQGAIVDNTSDFNEINPDKIARAIRKARENENIKAVVFRVNSPGGSAYGSEQIWREVELTKKVKPVIISMGDYAASGGYYISCAGTKIIADKNTITGSIGIYTIIPNAKELVQNKIGVTFDFVSTNKNGVPINLTEPLNPFQRRLFQNRINKGYELFVSRVSNGRNIPVNKIKEIARGRVWSGAEAVKIGLVDEIGDLQRAIKVAEETAKVEDFEVVAYPKVKDPFSELLDKGIKGIQINIAKDAIGKTNYKMWKEISRVKDFNGNYAILPYYETIH